MKNIVLLNRPTLFLAATITLLIALLSAPRLAAAGDWKESFNDICSKTQTSDTLSVQELTALIERADKLLPEIQASDDPAKKVYLTRLKKCRGVYEFMIDTKKGSGK